MARGIAVCFACLAAAALLHEVAFAQLRALPAALFAAAQSGLATEMPDQSASMHFDDQVRSAWSATSVFAAAMALGLLLGVGSPQMASAAADISIPIEKNTDSASRFVSGASQQKMKDEMEEQKKLLGAGKETSASKKLRVQKAMDKMKAEAGVAKMPS
eukprot:CAMPEP_0115103796 /NCGR_PEP_ID=MMETSP0227-20121206/34843_1 /TAXON_ID=89957 /ORGANISM="Polarella glacialis, Strain CCMP 1383" /LENGTH=158 /DNA_ID=CAMNT_0002500411 /DNA_START=58 /DNA_END=535 /DNA_ORIENTATION=+